MAEQVKALSLTERSSKVRRAFYRMGFEQDVWFDEVVEVYDDDCIICVYYGEYYRAPYSITADGVVVPSIPDDWTKVEMEWIEANASPAATKAWERKITFGSTVKALGDGKVGGHLVLFGSPNELDLHGEYFDQETDFDIEDGMKSAVYYNHGFDPALKKRKLGTATIGVDNVGVWIEAQLDQRDEYEQAVYKLAEMEKLGWSSGTAAHLVETEQVNKSVHIKRWPLGLDASLTPTPADPRQMTTLKAFSLSVQPLERLLPDTPPEAVKTAAAVVTPDEKPPADSLNEPPIKHSPTIIVGKDNNMGDVPENTAPPAEDVRLTALETGMKAISDQMTTLLTALQNTPKGEGQVYTNTGGKSDPEVKSLGDFCLAMARGDEPRLKFVYKAQKSLAEDQGATGGYLVPQEFSAELIAAQTEISPIINLVRTFPVKAPAGEWPVLDIYTAPTAGAGNTAMAGQLVSSVIAEAGTFTDRNVKFRMINWRVAKVGDVVDVSSELLEDAPAIEALLRQVMTTALAAKKERNILRGNGVGEPLGILNAPALISYNPATSNVFAWADSVGMRARFKMFGGDKSRVRWVIHSSVLPDIAVFQAATGSSATWIANMQNDDPSALSLLTYALFESEHVPQADNDNSVGLFDFGAYGIWQRGQIDIAYSEDYKFNTDQVTWRFKERYDGRPLINSSVTLADPQGSFTKSAFIGLNATHV